MHRQGVEQLRPDQSEGVIAIVSSSGSWLDRVSEAFRSSGITTNPFAGIESPEVVLKQAQRPLAVMLAVPGADVGSVQKIAEWGRCCETAHIPLVVVAGGDPHHVFGRAINNGAKWFATKSSDPRAIGELIKDVTGIIANYPRIPLS